MMHSETRVYPTEPQITAGLILGSQAFYRYSLRESTYPTLSLVDTLTDGEGNMIPPGHYELALSDERDFLILMQSKNPIALIPVFKVEVDMSQYSQVRDNKALKQKKKQEKEIAKQQAIVAEQFKDSGLEGKKLTRKVDDNTFINFADFIFNNLENAKYNISKIRISLSILKDGQAVFTNLEKLYIYRYVFCKGVECDIKIKIDPSKIQKIPEPDIKKIYIQMMKDLENPALKNITLRQDKLLWIAREYKKQNIYYVEISDTDLAKANGPAIKLIEELHYILPYIEKETGVKIRFLVALRRIPLTIIQDQIISGNYLRSNLDVLKTVAKSPYVVGSDFIGEEINDVTDLCLN